MGAPQLCGVAMKRRLSREIVSPLLSGRFSGQLTSLPQWPELPKLCWAPLAPPSSGRAVRCGWAACRSHRERVCWLVLRLVSPQRSSRLRPRSEGRCAPVSKHTDPLARSLVLVVWRLSVTAVAVLVLSGSSSSSLEWQRWLDCTTQVHTAYTCSDLGYTVATIVAAASGRPGSAACGGGGPSCSNRTHTAAG
jgi:hypothetical protein